MRVHIGIPMHGGSISTATMQSIHEALLQSKHQITYQCIGLSLLARNFNSLWITAFERGADYFVLHHSDLGLQSPYPGVSWVDILVNRIRQLNAAALSVASPIKSPHGHFSMGLDLEAGNPYTLRRTTARELLQLPKQFICRADLCRLYKVDAKAAGAMIINTGGLIIDIKRVPWAGLRWPGFNIVDSIEWSLNGKPQAFTEPEDWFFSRWMHKHRLPFYATREVILHHNGGHTFTNQGFWGELHDSTPLQPSIEIWHGIQAQEGTYL